MTTSLKDSLELVPEDIPTDFILKSTGEVSRIVSEPNQYGLGIRGRGEHTNLIRGPRAGLELLRQLLGGMTGAAKTEIESVRVPHDFSQFEQVFRSSQVELQSIWKRLQRAQAELDSIVCRLYGVDEEELDVALGAGQIDDEVEEED
jgi:hypothetical protein